MQAYNEENNENERNKILEFCAIHLQSRNMLILHHEWQFAVHSLVINSLCCIYGANIDPTTLHSTSRDDDRMN